MSWGYGNLEVINILVVLFYGNNEGKLIYRFMYVMNICIYYICICILKFYVYSMFVLNIDVILYFI